MCTGGTLHFVLLPYRGYHLTVVTADTRNDPFLAHVSGLHDSFPTFYLELNLSVSHQEFPLSSFLKGLYNFPPPA